MPRKVFISYRRDDSRYQARMVYSAFTQVVARENVFMDIDSIPLGTDFRKILKEWVEQCDLLLALIGPGWINAVDPKTGEPRLKNSADFVRIEISASAIACLVLARLPRTFTEQRAEQSGWAADVVRALFPDRRLSGVIAPSRRLPCHA